MSASKGRTVLITGCSDGGLGSSLAIAFHNAGLHVYATARNASKMAQLAALGIETIALDVLSESSIADCVSRIPSLDILLNNAGVTMAMAVSDISIPKAKELFDVNVWSQLAMSQAFLPLLIKSKGMIVNHTSMASVLVVPFVSAYAASKAAASMFSNSMRLELEVFGISVVELKTGVVGPTNLSNNSTLADDKSAPLLPKDSIYQPAREVVEKALRQEQLEDAGTAPDEWARLVVKDLLQEKPPLAIWRGESAMMARIGSFLPVGMLDGVAKRATKFNEVEEIMKLALE